MLRSIASVCVLDMHWHFELIIFCMNLQGGLPQALGNLTNLRQFILSGNVLVGSVPAYVGAYPGVGEAWLARNNLSGQLTDGLCSNSAGNESIHLEARHQIHDLRGGLVAPEICHNRG